MASYIIEGGKRLEGSVNVSGSKNASLPIIAGSILNRGKVELHNVPNIRDVNIMFEILKILGCEVTRENDKVIIDSSMKIDCKIPEDLMRKMRSSVMLAGAIIGREKKAVFSYPGGCDIGARPIDLHLNALKQLGIDIIEDGGYITCKADKIIGSEIILDFPSVGATENAILSSIHCEGTTIIRNAAREPEIEDLQKFLVSMGAKVEGAGTNLIMVTGVKELKDTVYTIMPDRIETGTLLCVCAVTHGKIQICNCVPEHISPVIYKLKETGCKIDVNRDIINIEVAKERLRAVEMIKTMPYPGFPTDMQSIMAATLINAKGTSVIVENIFENRYKYVGELIRMGAKITIEGRSAIIKGKKNIHGAVVNSTDLRGGAALVIAGLMATGKTTVNNISYIQRGYDNLADKLNSIGAKIIVNE